MFQQIQLTIGHNVEGKPTHSIQHVCKQVEQILGVEAYTAIPCLGMWKGTAEDSTRIEIVTDPVNASTIRANVPYLAYALDQEAIMCQIGPHFEFVEPAKPTLAIFAA